MLVLRRIHRWIGLLIAIPIAVQGLTGTILAAADLLPDQRASLMQPRPVNDIVAQAVAWAGADAHATRYFAPRRYGYVARVELALPNDPPRLVRIDPATLAVLGSDAIGGGALGWVRSLHVQLLAGAYGGRGIVGWCGIGLLAMLLTAVPIWWPRRKRIRQAFTADFSAQGAVFHRRLHGAAGAWITSVLVVLAVTGIAMAFPSTTRALLGLEQREPPPSRHGGNAPVTPPADLDRAVALARQALAQPVTSPQSPITMTLRSATLPTHPGEPIRLVFDTAGNGGAVGAIQVQVDPRTSLSQGMDSPATRRSADSLLRWMHDLHTGSGIGAWWQVLAAMAGLFLPLLSITGCTMWWRRRAMRLRPRHLPSGVINAPKPTVQ